MQATFRERQSILDAGLEATIAVLTGSDERHVRLRQSASLAGETFINREERNAILRQFAINHVQRGLVRRGRVT